MFSLISTIVAVTVAYFVDNWIYSNFIAICICVASIKIFHYASLKEAYISKFILIIVFSSISTAIHYLQPERSYNDYAT